MIDRPKRKQVSVRLRDASIKHLETVQSFYGLSATSAIAFLLGEAVRRIRVGAFDHNLATPAPALSSVVAVEEDDDDEQDAPRFGRQVTTQNRIDRQRDESK